MYKNILVPTHTDGFKFKVIHVCRDGCVYQKYSECLLHKETLNKDYYNGLAYYLASGKCEYIKPENKTTDNTPCLWGDL